MHLFLRLAREWDLRFEKMFKTGALSKWYSSIGNEATTVGCATALEPGDALLTLHRDSGAILRYYLDAEQLFPGLLPKNRGRAAVAGDSRERLHRLACQMLGRREGFSKGYERSYHYSHFDEPAGLLHIGMISHLGSKIPVAAGCAFAFRHRGSDRVALNFIGEGATSTGDFHEGLNMAAVWKLPFILVIENNRWAFSTPTHEQYACASLADRAVGYGIPGHQVDGNDPEAVLAVMRTAVARARAGEGPTLIEAMLGRHRGHSEGDDSLTQVPEEELGRHRASDPLDFYERRLIEHGDCDQEHLDTVSKRCHDLWIEVVDRAVAAPEPDFDEVRSIHAVRAVPTSTGKRSVEPKSVPAGPATTEPVSYIDAISRALRDAMRADPSVILLGQDIAGHGGAFKITQGFLEEFGPKRVRNTPIAESGTIGIGVGAAMLGLKPVVEMQFADFISCGFNQTVNVAAKMFFRTERPVPMVIRLPGGGGVGAGAFHSQNIEGWFLHTPGLKVVAPAFADDAYRLLRAAIEDPNPVLFFEHKFLYRREKGTIDPSEPIPGTLEGRGVVRRVGRDLTIVSYGWMTHRALEAAEELAKGGIEAEVIDLPVLAPLRDDEILESVRKTSRAMIVHEATITGGFGAELSARIAEGAMDSLDAPIQRIAYPDSPPPYHKGLEAARIPSVDRIVEGARRIIAW